MKIKKLFALLLALTLLTCTFVMPTSAKEETVNENVEIEILSDNVSEETKANIEKYFANGEPAEDDGASTYGVTCTLLGHKLTDPITVVSTIHKVRTTAPRCCQKTYKYEECTRCDYTKSTLLNTKYIACC